MEGSGIATLEPTEQAEAEWTKACFDLANQALFGKTALWIFGANIPGKKTAVYFYIGGLNNFRDKIHEVTDAGYSGFKLEK